MTRALFLVAGVVSLFLAMTAPAHADDTARIGIRIVGCTNDGKSTKLPPNLEDVADALADLGYERYVLVDSKISELRARDEMRMRLTEVDRIVVELQAIRHGNQAQLSMAWKQLKEGGRRSGWGTKAKIVKTLGKGESEMIQVERVRVDNMDTVVFVTNLR